MNSIVQLMALALLLLSTRVTTAFIPTSHSTQSFHHHRNLNTSHNNQFFDTLGSVFKNFGKKASASHILIKPEQLPTEEAVAKLMEIKEEIANDPAEFARFASEYSDCPSKAKGGDLGQFGPGMMVKEFDAIAFGEDVGVVHGPVSTSFGQHLILVTSRSGEEK